MVRVGGVLGPYEVIELLGEGGMGAVFKARDGRLGRDVAIKVIRPEIASHPDGFTRFDREARLLASLNHPNIATVYGFELIDDVPLLVMEVITGQTLVDRCRSGPLPLKEALAVGGQIAAAMEAAHGGGVIHRDLKPSNIRLTPSGAVKVLDFGLAKALRTDSSAASIADSPTLTSGATADGVVLGTAAFMSPEQARGQPIDKRTDVWAFGCVLFEMLTGRSAFGGATLSDTLSNVLTRDPDWGALPPRVPPAVRRLLRRCLEKDYSRRLRDMGDARLELEDAGAAEGDDSGAITPSFVHTARKRLAIVAVLSAVLGGGLVAMAVWLMDSGNSVPQRGAISFAVSLPPSEQVTSSDFPVIAIAPNETHLVYVGTRGGRSQLFVRSLSELEPVALAGTEGALAPFFSPDGQWIGFFADGKLKKVPLKGGPIRTLAEAPIGFGATWDGDSIIFAPANGSALVRVPADGGTATGVTELDTARGEFSHRWPDVRPDGRAVLFTAGTEGNWDDAEIIVQPRGGARSVLVHGGSNPRFLPGGRLAYVRAGTLFVASYEESTWRLTSEAVPVLSGVAQSLDGAAQFSVSGAGGLVYLPAADDGTERRIVWVNRQGAIEPSAAPPRAYTTARLSPDGRRIAVVITDRTGEAIWTYDIARNVLAQLTYDGGSHPVWSGDGTRIIFSAVRDGGSDLLWKGTDSSGVEERLTRSPTRKIARSMSPDGSAVAFDEEAGTTGKDVVLLSLDDRAVRPFLNTAANETALNFSPDGRWIAYVSDVGGRNEVFLAPRTDPAKATPVSVGGGTEPRWRQDGVELFYRASDRMMAAVVKENGSVEKPRLLFRHSFLSGSTQAAYDVSADGTRFLVIASPEEERAPRDLRVVLGWSATAQQRSGGVVR